MKIPRPLEGFFEQMGRFVDMAGRVFAWTPRPPYDVPELLRQMVKVGINSIPVVLLTTLFTAAVLAFYDLIWKNLADIVLFTEG